jgi:CrcB protein
VSWLLVVLGAAVGAPARYLVDRTVQTWHASVFPVGTLVVNVAASLLLGLVTGAVAAGAAPPRVGPLVGTGLCGALSTYSTFSYETLRLVQAGARSVAALNAMANVVLTLAAAAAGVALGHALGG